MKNPRSHRVLRSVVVAAALLASPASQAAPAAPSGAKAIEGGPTLHISAGPPTNNSDVKLPAPSPKHVWLPGFWEYQAGHHVWIKGRWEPARDGMVYLASQWSYQGHLWTFYPGKWVLTSVAESSTDDSAPQKPQNDLMIKVPPPAQRLEVPGPPPSPQHQWNGGYWTWKSGHFVWLPGHWATAPADMIWDQGHYRKSGLVWHLIPGHWRKK